MKANYMEIVNKLEKTILSCNNVDQLDGAMNMLDRFWLLSNYPKTLKRSDYHRLFKIGNSMFALERYFRWAEHGKVCKYYYEPK